jgi:hypothetical protein
MQIPYRKESEIESVAEELLSKRGMSVPPINVELLAEKIGFRIVPIYSCDDSFKGCLFPKIKEIGIKSSFFEDRAENI